MVGRPAWRSWKYDHLSPQLKLKLGLGLSLAKLNSEDARLRFAIRSRITKTVKNNFKGNHEYRKFDWKCIDCDKLDTQEHILGCPSYEHLRKDKNLQNDSDLVQYFRQVINMRLISDVGSSDCTGT